MGDFGLVEGSQQRKLANTETGEETAPSNVSYGQFSSNIWSHSPTRHHHLSTIRSGLKHATQNKCNGTNDDCEVEISIVIRRLGPDAFTRCDLLATLLDKASANREAGIQPQKALRSRSIYEPGS